LQLDLIPGWPLEAKHDLRIDSAPSCPRQEDGAETDATLEARMNTHAPIADTIGLTALLEKQRAAFLREGPPTRNQRLADLVKLKELILTRRDALTQAVIADFGHRAPYETTIMEIVPIVQGIDYLCRRLKRWMRPRRRHVAFYATPGKAHVVYQPRGVVGIVSPWNFPLGLALMPLATAIAAGNRVMLKPSELTPTTTALMATMLRETFPEEQVATVIGGADVGAAFSALRFDHLLFTGSTNVGRAVMRAASDNLVPVTLELGGKSPAIVDRGFSTDRAACSIAYGKLANAGQICIAPDYVILHEEDRDNFVSSYIRAARKLYSGGTSDPGYASIINAHHVNRLESLIQDAKKKGAQIVDIEFGAKHERMLAPVIVLGATPDMEVMQEEIFGPILPIVSYQDVNDAIVYVNAAPRPLALYIFSDDRNLVDKVLTHTTSGNVTVNDTLMHYAIDDLPFGGVGASGIGAYHGEEGFKTFSHSKGVFEQPKWNFAGLVRPPFGRMTDLILSYLLR
jgi:coniferyl-aldehyde dehydrogenase